MTRHVEPVARPGVGAVFPEEVPVKFIRIDPSGASETGKTNNAAAWLYPFQSILRLHPGLQDPEFFCDIFFYRCEMLVLVKEIAVSHFFIQDGPADMDLFLGRQETLHQLLVPASYPAYSNSRQPIGLGKRRHTDHPVGIITGHGQFFS